MGFKCRAHLGRNIHADMEKTADNLIRKIFQETRRIAVFGMSRNRDKSAQSVPAYMSRHFEIIPVNPNADEVLG